MLMDKGGRAKCSGSGGLFAWFCDLLFRAVRVSGWMLLVLLPLTPAGSCQAEENEKTREELPSMEVLEFLGEWQTGEGVWFDPTEKEPPQAPAQEQSHD